MRRNRRLTAITGGATNVGGGMATWALEEEAVEAGGAIIGGIVMGGGIMPGGMTIPGGIIIGFIIKKLGS